MRTWGSRHWTTAALVCVLLAVAAATAVATPGPPGGIAADSDRAPLTTQEGIPTVTLQDQPEADATVTRIALDANGTATWTVAVRTRLESADDVQHYERFQDRFRDNRSRFLGTFRERMRGVVAGADDATSREMGAEAFGASTRIEEVPQRWGVVEYRFRWRGFAAAGDGRVVAGDVFGGSFFIEENSVLQIVLPEDYELESARPTPQERTDGTIEWEGPTSFAGDQPRVVAVAPSGGDGSVPWAYLAAGLLGLAVLLAVAIARWRGFPELPDRTAVTEHDTGEAADAGTGVGAPQAEGPPEPAATDPGPGPIADEDRVSRLLAANGGRLKQSRIVEELDWSKSKTSRVLSSMAEEGRVEKLRLGRENVIELAGDGED